MIAARILPSSSLCFLKGIHSYASSRWNLPRLHFTFHNPLVSKPKDHLTNFH